MDVFVWGNRRQKQEVIIACVDDRRRRRPCACVHQMFVGRASGGETANEKKQESREKQQRRTTQRRISSFAVFVVFVGVSFFIVFFSLRSLSPSFGCSQRPPKAAASFHNIYRAWRVCVHHPCLWLCRCRFVYPALHSKGLFFSIFLIKKK
jgi:hypothetical protein